MKARPNCKPYWVSNSNELESIVKKNIEDKEVSHYLFVNDWDTPCIYFKNRLKELESKGGDKNVYVVDNFEIPNGLGVLRSAIKENKETISTNAIQNYTGVPMLVRLHAAFPVTVTYTGSISAELGL